MKKIFILFLTMALFTPCLKAQTLSTEKRIKSNNATTLDAGIKLSKFENGALKLSTQKVTQLPSSVEFNSNQSTERLPVSSFSFKNAQADIDTVLYRRPNGYFFAGFSPNFYSSTLAIMFGPAYTEAAWYNYSDGSSIDNYSWTLPDPEDPEGMNTMTLNETAPSVAYPFNLYSSTPKLTASSALNSQSYTWGQNDVGMYILNGSTIAQIFGDPVSGFMPGAVSYDMQEYGITQYFIEMNTDGSYDYSFGTTDDHSITSIANSFLEPPHPYVLDSLWINAAFCTAPVGTEFELIILGLNSGGEVNDTIATSKITIEDVYGPYAEGEDYLYTLMFNSFDVYDDELGFEVTYDYLEIENGLLVELTGFDKEGVTFSALCQEMDFLDIAENHAFIKYDAHDGFGQLWTFYTGATSLAMNLGMTYSFLESDANSFSAAPTGSSKTFNLNCLYSPEEMWLSEELPSWLTATYTFDENTWDMSLTLTAEALPDANTERSTDIVLNTYGASTTISVIQNSTTGVSKFDANDVSVYANNGMVTVNYPESVKSVSLYSLIGQLLETHNLSTTGKDSFTPAQNRNQMYILKFEGRNTQISKKLFLK